MLPKLSRQLAAIAAAVTVITLAACSGSSADAGSSPATHQAVPTVSAGAGATVREPIPSTTPSVIPRPSSVPSNVPPPAISDSPLAQQVAQPASSPKYVQATNWQLCNYILSADTGHTYQGYIYASVPGSVLLYWVNVENFNFEFWSGDISLDTQDYGNLGLVPYKATWLHSPSIFLGAGQRRWEYKITISPNSDVSELMLLIWAPACS